MRVAVTGATGMLGASLVRAWRARPDDELVPLGREDLDLRDRRDVRDRFASERFDLVVHTAAVVGGIKAKLADPVPYLLENLAIDSSVFGGALDAGVPALVYLASAAAYPEDAPQPLEPASLLGGRLEPANESYGLAKAAGLKLCADISRARGLSYRALLPCNLYGPGDRQDADRAHLIAAALGRVHDAYRRGLGEVVIWGDGTSRREFVFADDLSDWIVSQADKVDTWPATLNVGAGHDWPIDHFYEVIADVVGYHGRFVHDLTKPNGARRRLLDSSSAIALGWAPRTSLHEGVRACYAQMLQTLDGDL